MNTKTSKYLLKPQSGYSREMSLTDLTAMCRDLINLDCKLKAQSKSGSYTDNGSELLRSITNSEKIRELTDLIGKEREVKLTQVKE